MRIAVFNTKGGTGKTTTAVFLAAVCSSRGLRVMLVDADTDQSYATARDWCQTIPDAEWVTYTPESVPDEVKLDDFGVVIIDVPPSNPEKLKKILAICDAALIVAGTGLGEQRALVEAIDAALLAKVAVHVLLTRVDSRRQTRNDEARAAVDAIDPSYCLVNVIPHRAGIIDVYGQHPRTCLPGWCAYNAVWRQLDGAPEDLTDLVGTHG